MNRLHLDVASESRCRRKPNQNFQSDQQRTPQHRFFIPLHYEKNYGYPLLVWLHGPTGSEIEINHVMPHISLRNYIGVSPRGVVRHAATYPNGDPTFTWDQQPTSTDLAMASVLQCVASAKRRFNIADDRVFLCGNDVGGTMALRLALSAPEYFAGIVSIGGAMPDARQPLSALERARSMPVLIAHSRDSTVYQTEEACADLRLLYSAGMSVSLRQYPCDHEVTTKMLSDVNSWLMERISGVSAAAPICDDPTRMRIHDCN